jgi:hypothetical protein
MIVVSSQHIGINTKDGALELTLPRMTPARAMWKILAKAARSKIAEFPKSWNQSRVLMSVIIGNDVEQFSFRNTQHYLLQDYPVDERGSIRVDIGLSRPSFQYENLPHSQYEDFIVLQTQDEQNERVWRKQVQTGAEESKRKESQIEDSKAIERPKIKRSHKRSGRRVMLEIVFRGMPEFNRTTTIEISNNATFDILSQRFAQEIRDAVRPEYLSCLLIWTSEIGTDLAGYEAAAVEKVLLQYPGSDEPIMTAKITAGLMRGTVVNLRQPDPKILSSVPPPHQFNRWMKSLASHAGIPTNSSLGQHGAATYNSAEQKSQEARINAERYGYLVERIRWGTRQVW